MKLWIMRSFGLHSVCLTETTRLISIIVKRNIFPLPLQGWLSGAELRFMLANLGEKLPFEEVDMLLQEAGIDNDGRFNYNDFIRKLSNQ